MFGDDMIGVPPLLVSSIYRLTVLLILVIILPGCGKLATPAAPAVVQSQDGSCEVTIPVNWVERPTGTTAVLRIGVASEDALFMVLRFAKEDLAADEDYRRQGSRYMDELASSPSFENAKITKGPDDILINGRSAVRYQVEGLMKIERTRFILLISVVDGQKSIFRLVGTLVPSSAAKYHAAIADVTNSFVERP
jgi:hypothetical protein